MSEDRVARIFEDYLAELYPGTRWISKPTGPPKPAPPTFATARQLLDAKAARAKNGER